VPTLLLLIVFSLIAAQPAKIPGNLLIDPGADAGGSGWTTSREGATIELLGGNACFVIRNQGSFQQNVPIPATAPGTHVVFLARASGERINADGAITDRPYLYGLIFGTERGRIVGHLQGDSMRSHAKAPNEWTTLSGVFPVPEGATAISLQLKLGERRGLPHDGSAGRFDDVALVLLPSERDARAFVATYQATR